MDKLTNSLDYIVSTIKSIKNFFEYLSNPSKIFGLFWNWTLKYSYIICLIVCTGAIMLYIFGRKKSGKWATISIGIYALIQALGSAFK